MTLSKADIVELKELQPELVVIGNKISGCFYLSATLVKKSKNRGKKLSHYAWNYEDKGADNKYIHDYFYIEIVLNDDLYPIQAFETSGKILSWKEKIPEEYWHINSDDSLCLGEKPDILERQKQYSFAQFINILLMQYFYYMYYVKKYSREPWIAYRHGLFAMLETAYNSKNIKENLEFLNKIYKYCKDEWDGLLVKTHTRKIEKNDPCPFCKCNKLAKNCTTHKKQIKGYNNLISFSLHQ